MGQACQACVSVPDDLELVIEAGQRIETVAPYQAKKCIGVDYMAYQRLAKLQETDFEYDFDPEFASLHVQYIISIQSLIRKYLAKKKLRLIKAKYDNDDTQDATDIKPKSIYFTKQEFLETLSSSKLNTSDRLSTSSHTYASGAIYSGQFLGNFRHGQGTITWPCGAKYSGLWSFGEPTQLGTFTHSSGDSYTGSWSNNRCNGLGKYTYQDGTTYHGFWNDDLQQGIGMETSNDGSKYVGYFSQGQKNGLGIYQWKSGQKYQGEWHSGQISGLGMIQWTDGRSYTGNWVDGKMHGLGINHWKDKRSFKGEYNMDRKQGFGIYKQQDGAVYQGYWKNGKQHGLGLIKLPKSQQSLKKYIKWNEGKPEYTYSSDKELQEIQEKTFRITDADDDLFLKKMTFDTPPRFFERLQKLAIKLNNIIQECKIVEQDVNKVLISRQ